jgi:NHL repeat
MRLCSDVPAARGPRAASRRAARASILGVALALLLVVLAVPSVAGATGLPTDTWYVGSFGSFGAGDGQFQAPSSITASPVDGSLYIADSGNNRIVHMTAAGQFLGSWTAATPANPVLVDPANTVLENPVAVAVSLTGQVYVVDQGLPTDILPSTQVPPAPVTVPDFLPHRRVVYYSPTGAYLGEWRTVAAQPSTDAFNKPVAVAIAANGNVIVMDEQATATPPATIVGDLLHEFQADGTWVQDLGSGGGLSGSTTIPPFAAAQDMAIAPNGDIYVADTGNNVIQQLNAGGGFTAGTPYGVGAAQFGAGGPRGIAWSTLQTVYATDPVNGRVASLNMDLLFQNYFGTPGTGAGQMTTPLDAAVVQDNIVCVLDTGPGIARVELWKQDREPPKTVAAVNGRTVTLTRTDNLSGVFTTGWAIDGAATSVVPGVNANPPYGSAGPFSPLVITMPKGVHTLTFYSIDNAGNLEQANVLQVIGSPQRPVADALADITVKKNQQVYLPYEVTDPYDVNSTVTVKIVNKKGKVIRKFTITDVIPNVTFVCSFKNTFKKGTYKWKVTAKDAYGSQTKQAGVAKLIVK